MVGGRPSDRRGALRVAAALQVGAGTTPAQPAWVLVNAAARSDRAPVPRLPDVGVAIDSRDARACSALLVARHANQVELARFLTECAADVPARDNQLDSAFLYAGAEGRFDTLRITLVAGADLNSTNRYGGTAPIPAALHGHVEPVRERLTTNVDLDHVNRLG